MHAYIEKTSPHNAIPKTAKPMLNVRACTTPGTSLTIIAVAQDRG